MNFLAHARLSFDMPEILAGNMISDFVKGKKQYDYPLMIQHGIKLHRAIDTYTDVHPSTETIKQLFRPVYRLYSGAIVDVVYDYFLANDKTEFENDTELQTFSEKVYSDLDQFSAVLPANFMTVLPYMMKHNWLFNYRLHSGIQRSLQGVAARAKYMDDPALAFNIFLQNEEQIRNEYINFFPMLKSFAITELRTLLNTD